MNMKREHIITAVTVVAIAFAGYFLVPLLGDWATTTFPTFMFPVLSNRAATLLRMVVLHHVVPGLAVGAILSIASVLLCPSKHIAVLVAPSLLLFLAYLHMHIFLIETEYSAVLLMTFLVPEWVAIFVAATGVAVIGKKLKVSNKTTGSDS